MSGVLVIVAARNNGPYLADALTSLTRQQLPAAEILYADDGSTDGSPEIAARCAGEARNGAAGVRVLRLPPRGAVAARNAGYAAATIHAHRAPYVLFADGDDLYSADLLSDAVAALEADKSCAVAYPNILQLHVGPEGGHTSAWPGDQTWRRDALAEENYVPSCSVIRRCAFEAAGGWEEVGGTYWDWWLWLRITRQGWRMSRLPARSYLLYRRYPTQNSVVHQPARPAAYAEISRRLPSTVFTPFAPGRWRWAIPLWTENLRRSGLPLDRAQLIVMDNTRDPAARRALLEAGESLAPRAFTLLADATDADGENRHRTGGAGVSELLCSHWRRALALADGDLLWSLEDDVRIQAGDYARLVSALRPHVGIVGSPAVSRWRRPLEVMVYRWVSHRPFDLARLPNGRVDYRGLACAGVESVGSVSCCSTLIRRTVYAGYAPMPSAEGGARWSGWEFSLMRRARDVGRDVLCHWGAPADHLLDDQRALTVADWRRALARPTYYERPAACARHERPAVAIKPARHAGPREGRATDAQRLRCTGAAPQRSRCAAPVLRVAGSAPKSARSADSARSTAHDAHDAHDARDMNGGCARATGKGDGACRTRRRAGR